MNREQQEKQAVLEKMAASNARDYQTQGIGLAGSLAQSCGEAFRPSLRERIFSDLYRAQRESSKTARLEELSNLLDKHPDVARILELMEEVRS